MTAPRYAELAGKLFAREGRSSVPPPDPATRARAIAAIADAIGARARRKRVARAAWGVSAAAAVALAAVGLARHVRHHEGEIAGSRVPSTTPAAGVQIVAKAVSGATSVLSSGARAPLTDESTVALGSRLVTPAHGQATLAFSTGTNVVLGEGSDMSLGGDGVHQLLRLSAGSIDLHVAKLTAEQRFVVGTSDAEVEVRGTRFHVSIVRPDSSCGEGTPTRVSVTEGVVIVRHGGVEDRIVAGDVWPRDCGRSTGSGAAGDGVPAMASPIRAQGPVSTLAEQNDLMALAFAAKNGGDARAAVAGFERLLEKYPSSSMAHEARLEIMRLLASVSPSQGAAAARLYLAAYPKGTARDEAERIISEAP